MNIKPQIDSIEAPSADLAKTKTFFTALLGWKLRFLSGIVGMMLAQVASVYSVENTVLFQYGLIADCQYCSDPGLARRKYSMSVGKLRSCIDQLNTMNLAYVVHLGDFIDRDYDSFKVVSPVYKELRVPGYHVLGNHDFSVADEYKERVPQTMGMPSKYYDFRVQNWRFVVLDGNDVSFHAYPGASDEQQTAEDYYEKYGKGSPKWNGAIGKNQLSWLKGVLEEASGAGENVVLYCHFPVYPANNHNLWNAIEVVELLESYSCVNAYINGHNHAGNYGIKKGIHYLTLKGMVETVHSSYAVIQVSDKSLRVMGYGREENRILNIR